MSRNKTKIKKKSKIRSKERWIQKMDLKKDATRDYVKRKYGKSGFTESGTIKVSILREIVNDPSVHAKTRRRAQLALNLKKMNH